MTIAVDLGRKATTTKKNTHKTKDNNNKGADQTARKENRVFWLKPIFGDMPSKKVATSTQCNKISWFFLRLNKLDMQTD